MHTNAIASFIKLVPWRASNFFAEFLSEATDVSKTSGIVIPVWISFFSSVDDLFWSQELKPWKQMKATLKPCWNTYKQEWIVPICEQLAMQE